MRSPARGFAVLVLLAVALWVAFTFAVRTRNQSVIDAVRRVNRAVTNPQAMRTAGQQRGVASVIRHYGRKSGTAYETPVSAFQTGAGFVIPLTYGANTDWVKNVLVSGSAAIVNKGVTYPVHRPEVVALEIATPHLPLAVRRILRLYNVDTALQVELAGAIAHRPNGG